MPTLKAALASVGKDNQSALETDNATSLRPATSPCHQRFSARAFIVSSILASLLTCFVCYIGFGGSGSDIRLHSCPTCSECTACAELISPSCPVNPAPAFAAASQPKAMPQPKPSTDRKQNPYPMLKSVTKNLPEKSHRVALSTEETKVAPPTKVHNPDDLECFVPMRKGEPVTDAATLKLVVAALRQKQDPRADKVCTAEEAQRRSTGATQLHEAANEMRATIQAALERKQLQRRRQLAESVTKFGDHVHFVFPTCERVDAVALPNANQMHRKPAPKVEEATGVGEEAGEADEEEEEEDEEEEEEDGSGGNGDQDNDNDKADGSADSSDEDEGDTNDDTVEMTVSETEEAWLYAAAALGVNNSAEVARRAATQLEVRMAEFALVNATSTNATTNVTSNITPDARADCMWYASAQEDESLNSIRADAAVAVFLRRGAANATYAHAFSAACGIISPFRRFAAAQITDVFGIALLRANEVSSEMAHFVATHAADADFATGDANELPWRALLDTPWLAPYRDEDLEQQYYIRHSSPVRGFGLFAARALPVGTVIGQYTDQFRQSVMDTDFAWSTHYLWKHDAGHDNVDADHDGLELPALDVQLDSRSRGNALRFVNDDRLRLKNCESVSVIRNNLWHIFYRTTAPIAQDEELFIPYGAHYWKLRE